MGGMEVSLVSDIKKLKKTLSTQQRDQLPFAVANTLNSLAFESRKHIQTQLKSRLHNPTPYTLRGVQVGQKAHKKKSLVASVGFASKSYGRMQGEILPAEYMEFQIKGGNRFPRQRTIMAPTKHVKTNKFGNLGRNLYRKMSGDKAQYFKGTPTEGSKTGRKPRLSPEASGVWKRLGPKKNRRQGLQMQIGFEQTAKYTPRFPLARLVEKFIKRHFEAEFRKQLQRAMRSTR